MSLGIYIHIPFCVNKCPYCDFYSVAGADEKLKKRYIEALTEEIRQTTELFAPEGKDGFRLGKTAVTSIYFGGGTPSILEREDFMEIFSAVSDVFGDECLKEAEITIEVNPGTVSVKEKIACVDETACIARERQASGKPSPEKLRMLAELPFNRISVGVQSFDNGILKKLGRIHSSADSYRTIREAREAGFSNISVDLMFGMEWQSLDSWLDTVRRAAELKIEHISLYSLEIIEGTEFGRKLAAGRMYETDPEVDRRMYEYAADCLRDAGYEQYEISNFSYIRDENCSEKAAKNGAVAAKTEVGSISVGYGIDYRSRHNLKYWGLEEYLGYGAGAHSYLINVLTGKGRRHYHERDIEAYIEEPSKIIISEENEYSDDIQEYTITALRLNEGIAKREFFERFGLEFWDFYGDVIRLEFNSFVETGYAEEDEERIRLTIKGFNVSNRILALFV